MLFVRTCIGLELLAANSLRFLGVILLAKKLLRDGAFFSASRLLTCVFAALVFYFMRVVHPLTAPSSKNKRTQQEGGAYDAAHAKRVNILARRHIIITQTATRFS